MPKGNAGSSYLDHMKEKNAALVVTLEARVEDLRKDLVASQATNAAHAVAIASLGHCYTALAARVDALGPLLDVLTRHFGLAPS